MSEGDSGIKSHLKEIEERMNRTSVIGDSMKEAEQELENRLQEITAKGQDAQNDDKTNALRKKMNDLKQEYDSMMKESSGSSPNVCIFTKKREKKKKETNSNSNYQEWAKVMYLQPN